MWLFLREEKEKCRFQGWGYSHTLVRRKRPSSFYFKGENDGIRQKFYIGIDFNLFFCIYDDKYYDARRLHHIQKEKQLTLR